MLFAVGLSCCSLSSWLERVRFGIRIQIQDSDTGFRFGIQDSGFRFGIQIRDSDSGFKFAIQILDSDSGFGIQDSDSGFWLQIRI